ncbi:hypothetical protein GCM10014719_24040 [Planomonospora parontospora subsp. antibiotica]|nr:hypothetical protein GCM10014719_24040 [Planomonospora parontospora subsp. antibiotica]GII15819.1 hypothetical protein Ppa05_25450 [Planomonospora parontospora subsp. antibiotica]
MGHTRIRAARTARHLEIRPMAGVTWISAGPEDRPAPASAWSPAVVRVRPAHRSPTGLEFDEVDMDGELLTPLEGRSDAG